MLLGQYSRVITVASLFRIMGVYKKCMMVILCTNFLRIFVRVTQTKRVIRLHKRVIRPTILSSEFNIFWSKCE